MKATLVVGAFLAAVLIASPVLALANPGDPISGVPIGLEHDPGSVVVSQTKTNSAGVAVFPNVKPGKYRLISDRWGSASMCPCVAVIEIPGQARVVQTISETAIGSMKTADQRLVPFIVERTKLQIVTVTITQGSGSNKESK